jgi:hypothetical protein
MDKMKQIIRAIIQKISPLYNFYLLQRRKMICNTPSKQYIKNRWLKVFGQELNLENPKTYNEKLQWEKIYASNPLAKRCADKVAVLEYVRERIGSEYIKEPIAIYLNTKKIDFSKLPKQKVVYYKNEKEKVLA